MAYDEQILARGRRNATLAFRKCLTAIIATQNSVTLSWKALCAAMPRSFPSFPCEPKLLVEVAEEMGIKIESMGKETYRFTKVHAGNASPYSAKPESLSARHTRLEAEARGFEAGRAAKFKEQMAPPKRGILPNDLKPEEGGMEKITEEAKVAGPFQGRVDAERIEGLAEREWASSKDLQAEFGSFDRYIAWRKAAAQGRARIFASNTVRSYKRPELASR